MTRRAVWGRLTMDRPVPVAADRSTTSSTIFSFENTFAGALRSSSNLRSSTKESSCSVARLLSAGISHITHANRGALHSVGEGRVWVCWAYGAQLWALHGGDVSSAVTRARKPGAARQSLQRLRRAHGSRRLVVSSRRILKMSNAFASPAAHWTHVTHAIAGPHNPHQPLLNPQACN